MSLAPASSRGAFLKARLAVNGIQCAARSLGTLTAAGRGLLSSMGASLRFGRGVYPQAISFAAQRERHGPRYLRSIRRFEGAQGHIKGIDEAVGCVGHFDPAVQLLAERLDQPGSEAPAGRGVDRRTSRFAPGQTQPRIVLVDGPCNLDTPRGHRQRAELRGVGAEFVERHCQSDHRTGCNLEVGASNRKLPLALSVKRLG